MEESSIKVKTSRRSENYMKYTGKRLTYIVDSLANEYGGSIMNIPDKRLKPIQDDFKNGREKVHHHYVDEADCPWNRTLKTDRLKVYKTALALRQPNFKRALKSMNLNPSTVYNVIYQLHLKHRGYIYKCKGHPEVIVSYRRELIDAIKIEELPGPRSETELSLIMKNNGWYMPTGKKVGKILKIVIYRGIFYMPATQGGHSRKLAMQRKLLSK